MCDEYCGLNCEYRYPNCLSRYYIGNKESVSPGHLPDPNYQPQPSRIYREDLLTEYTTGPNSLICYFHCLHPDLPTSHPQFAIHKWLRDFPNSGFGCRLYINPKKHLQADSFENRNVLSLADKDLN